MDKTALLIIDAQQEYFAPVGKMVLPDGPKAVKQIVPRNTSASWGSSR